MSKIQCVDHLGLEHESITSMCRSYGISTSTFRNRIKNDWTLEEALTLSPSSPGVSPVCGEDHIGMFLRMSCGLGARIISYTDHYHIVVRFEDGNMVTGSISNFYSGKIGHPFFRLRGWFHYGFIKAKHFYTDPYTKKVYYMTECSLCGLNEVLTAKEIVAHIEGHFNSALIED